MLSVGFPIGDLPCRNRLCILHSPLKVIDIKIQLSVIDINDQTFFSQVGENFKGFCNVKSNLGFFSQKASKHMDHK